LPQIQPPLREWWGNQQPASPYYPNTAHAECHVLLMDASVRRIAGTVSEEVWKDAIGPDDHTPLSVDW
jgi:hypothetical protein